MSGISYTTAGAGSLMTTFSGSFTNAELLAGVNGPLFPGIVTQLYLNITANPTWPGNLPRMYLVMDIAISNRMEVILPTLPGDPFNLNWLPQEQFFTALYYTQSYASSFLQVDPAGAGLAGVTINYTALCWAP
jgi:hypothetical protein